MAAFIACVLIAGCSPGSFVVTPISADRTLQEHVVARESIWATSKIALIDVDGVLSNARGTSLLGGMSDNPVAAFKEKLDKAARDPSVAAIVLRINSPGGGVTASDLMYSESPALPRDDRAAGRGQHARYGGIGRLLHCAARRIAFSRCRRR